MNTDYQGIREKAGADGYKVDDDTFQELIEYARRKAKTAGRDESYLPFLLPDVIKEWHISRAINTYSIAMMRIQNIFKEVKRRGANDNGTISGFYSERSYSRAGKTQRGSTSRIQS